MSERRFCALCGRPVGRTSRTWHSIRAYCGAHADLEGEPRVPDPIAAALDEPTVEALSSRAVGFPSDFVDVTLPDGSRYHGAVQPDGSLRWFPPSGEDTEATRERGA